MKKFSLKKAANAGFSLIELLLVLTVIAALAVAAFIVFPLVQASRAASYQSQLLASAKASTQALFTSQDYRRLITSVAVDSKFFPDAMLDTTAKTITNQWGGVVTMSWQTAAGAAAPTNNAAANATPARFFSVIYQDVPANVCAKLVAGVSSSYGAIYVGATPVMNQYDAVTTNDTLNEAALATSCAAASTVTITFVSN